MYKVLIVDDEKMIREGIRRVIPWDSMEVSEIFTAASAGEALDLIRKHQPDLMVTDISMSEMSGLDLIGKLREDGVQIRIIVLTGFDRFDYVHQALKLKAHDFLLKPIDEEELGASIRRQLLELGEIRRTEEARRSSGRAQGVRQQWKTDQIMADFFEGRPVAPERKDDFLREMRLEEKQGLQAGIIVPDMVGAEDGEGRDFRIRSIQNICMGMLDQRGLGITFNNNSGHLLLVLFRENDGAGGDEAARELMEILRDECEIRTRLVLGSIVGSFEQLHISYNDAQHVLEEETRPFQDMILRNKAERSRETIFQEVFREFKHAMVAGIGDGEQVLHIFGRFCAAAESYNLSASYTAGCCFELASGVSFAYVSGSGNPAEESLNVLMKALNGTTRERACQVTETFLQRLLAGEQGSDHELIRKVKSRIHAGLGEDLTVAGIAAELYVTPNYLSRLFKRMTGEGCNEYIVRKRIEKAKALLEATTMKVGEIALTVGYVDMNYFSLAFKKHTGMSPTKYRDFVHQA